MGTHNGSPDLRQSRRRLSASTSLSAPRRAVIAAALVDRGVPKRLACALCCVNGDYVAKVRRMSEADRFRLLRGEISLSKFCNGHRHTAKPRATLADRLVNSTAAEKIEAAKALGVDQVWDQMVLPLVAEDRASQQAAE